jgi:NAD(P)-dependent dehydrogenase (short-subunit alcohol dehydrogenase family)
MGANRRVAIVTGAGRGLGKAIALALAGDGVEIVLAEIEPERARAAAAEVERLGVDTLAHQTDVTNRASVERMVEATVERFGRLDILVNNAGIIDPAPVLEMTEEQWDRVLAVDLKGVFLCSQAAGRHMVERRSGCIISIASVLAQFGMHGRANYCAAKAGLTALTRVLALEWAPFGVRVNAIGPGYVMTELQREAIAHGLANIEKRLEDVPLRRFAEPAEIGQVAAFLASEKASYITGQTIYPDGGWLIGASG